MLKQQLISNFIILAPRADLHVRYLLSETFYLRKKLLSFLFILLSFVVALLLHISSSVGCLWVAFNEKYRKILAPSVSNKILRHDVYGNLMTKRLLQSLLVCLKQTKKFLLYARFYLKELTKYHIQPENYLHLCSSSRWWCKV